MNIRKTLSVLLVAVLLLSILPVSAFADDVIQITTAQQLQDINNDVAGTYILMNDIDLSGISFTPIGNPDSGAFCGVFDGNGKTIKNLDVFSGKYAGLFGCNEGAIKNVTLENVFVCGTRYIGGVVGENTAYGTVENCEVKSGKIETGGGINDVYSGGIVGMNRGEMSGSFKNGAAVSIKLASRYNGYTGGIAGYTTSGIEWNSTENSGVIACKNDGVSEDDYGYSGDVYSGGLIGFSTGIIKLSSCGNSGAVEASTTGYYRYNYSYAYAGGLVGIISLDSEVNTSEASLSFINCDNSGSVEVNSTGYGYAGGFSGKSSVYGYDEETEELEDYLFPTPELNNCNNSGTIKANSLEGAYSGGFFGSVNGKFVCENCRNNGYVFGYSTGYQSGSAAGGFVVSCDESEFLRCINSGDVLCRSAGYSVCSGGIVAYCNKVIFLTCINNGTVTAKETSSRGWGYNTEYSGGFIGFCGEVIIKNSANNGTVKEDGENEDQRYCIGGFIGYCSNGKIEESYNTGLVATSSNKNYNGSYYYNNYTYSGGFIGVCANAVVNNSFNTGNLYSSKSSSSGRFVAANNMAKDGWNSRMPHYSGNITGGIIGVSVGSISIVADCYNTGNIIANDGVIYYDYEDYFDEEDYEEDDYVDYEWYLSEFGAGMIDNSYAVDTALLSGNISSNTGEKLLTISQMKISESFEDWDFGSVWGSDSQMNSGIPVLRDSASSLTLNESNATLKSGDVLQLRAYKNGVETNDVTWTTTYGTSIVNKTGKVKALGNGACTITATDADGNKANCNLFIMKQNNGVSAPDKTTDLSDANQAFAVKPGVSDSCDFIRSASSSDSGIVSICGWGGNVIAYNTKSVGSAVISFETVQGFTGSCTITVDNSVRSINVSSSSYTVKLNKTVKIGYSTTPSQTSSVLTWSSSDPSIATVDNNGTVTGVGKGRAIITVIADNGVSAQVPVTVTAPVTAMEFEKKSVTLYVGDSGNIGLIVTPSDTTDSISYSTSSSTYVSINSSTGRFTANKVGNATITATASSGVKTTCIITVKAKPVIVTSVTLNNTVKDLIVGMTYHLTETVLPSNATDKAVTWSSSDESVVTVTDGGTVEAIGLGSAVITCKSRNGVTASCDINVIDVSSIEPIEIVSQPANAYAETGQEATFTVIASGMDLAYQWQCSTNGGESWNNSGFGTAKSAALSVPVTTARNGYQYRCVITDILGNTANSNAVVLSVGTFAVTTQPCDVSAALGDTAVFTVETTGADVHYQWQYSANNGKTWVQSGFSSAKTATLSVPVTAARNGYMYKCVITDGTNTVTSDAAALTVVPAEIVIITQPVSVEAALGDTAVFTVETTGADVHYQWQYSANNGKTWVQSGFSSAKTATLSVPVTAARNGYMYKCIITDGIETLTSDAVTLTVVS